MAIKDLAFVISLFVTDKRGLFANVSQTLFRYGSLVSMVASSQEAVLGFVNLSKEWDKLEEKC